MGQTGYCFDSSLEGQRETLSSISYECWQHSALTNKGQWVWAELAEREQTFAASQHVGSEPLKNIGVSWNASREPLEMHLIAELWAAAGSARSQLLDASSNFRRGVRA